jgi:L,D-peptidoglycan transpeptidase YkuD (ErfK/YbiS/YcfS/YnhG family)
LTSFLSLVGTVAALATANARIASLEAELSASRKAYDVATTAKANAEKSQKSVLAKAKKMEKTLADVNKEHFQREQAVAEHLRTMSAAAGGKYSPCPSSLTSVAFLHLLIFSFPSFPLSPLLCRIYWGIFVDFATGR